LQVGDLATNAYLLGNEDSKEAIVIDPGGDGERILGLLNELNLELKYVVNTHGHYDHIAANAFLLDNSEADLLIHEDDAELLINPEYNLSAYNSITTDDPYTEPTADRKLVEGDQIECGKWSLKVIHTPGHTPGGMVLVGNGKLFAGDTIFAMGIGRTDLPKGSQEVLLNSLEEKIVPLAGDLEVYPGHGPTGKLDEIRNANPYL
jgi:glyoxylase-like metal-dependent hydrolase (beta-lactamase superfamily II)